MSVMSVQLLSSSAGQVNVTGDAKKADGFFGFADGKATIGWYLSAYIGRIVLQAALATDPAPAPIPGRHRLAPVAPVPD